MCACMRACVRVCVFKATGAVEVRRSMSFLCATPYVPPVRASESRSTDKTAEWHGPAVSGFTQDVFWHWERQRKKRRRKSKNVPKERRYGCAKNSLLNNRPNEINTGTTWKCSLSAKRYDKQTRKSPITFVNQRSQSFFSTCAGV